MNLSPEQQEMLTAVPISAVAGMFPEHNPKELMSQRRRLKRIQYEREYRERTYRSDSGHSSGDLLSRIASDEAARMGSEKLLRAINSLFAKWEDDNGFVSGAAAILLPAGYSDRRLAA